MGRVISCPCWMTVVGVGTGQRPVLRHRKSLPSALRCRPTHEKGEAVLYIEPGCIERRSTGMSKTKIMMMVSVGVLALGAFASASASAVTAGWMVQGTMLNGTKALATTAAVDEVGKFVFAGVTITCSGSVFNGANPKINSATNMGDAESLTFNGCSANEHCSVPTSISTLPILVELTLDGTLAVKGKFLPNPPGPSKKTFATIPFEGELCALEGKQPVSGTQAFLAPTGQDERTLQLITATQDTAGELKVGSFAATLKGSILIRLANGEPFSFL
jgi:hypothetical protein